mgnify:CR=1 FL=1
MAGALAQQAIWNAPPRLARETSGTNYLNIDLLSIKLSYLHIANGFSYPSPLLYLPLFRPQWYLDLSHNNLSGPLPNDWDNMMVRLRFLYLDNNSFTGTVPSYFSGLGNGRIKTMALDNNFLEGEVPSNWEVLNQLISLSFYNNNITTPMDPSICELSKYKQGEMVEMKVDCSICTCDTLCHTCVN